MNIENVFKSLGDPTRLKILELLPVEIKKGDKWSVNELVEELGCSQPNISHHLKLLKEAGLVHCEKMCCTVFYYKDKKAIEETKKYLCKIQGE